MIQHAVATRPSEVRYHGLDALRAWAMSMGIVLHAAWIMIPAEAGAPKTDASASEFTEFICDAIHTFRMQLFFVLAGLFACLLLQKRGLQRFWKNRFLRIAFPLIVFWLILSPIMVYQYQVAGIQSGAIQTTDTAWQLTQQYFANLTPSTVLLLHLWFLYYLVWTYVLVFACRTLIGWMDKKGAVRQRCIDTFGNVITRWWSIPLLAALFAVPMMAMRTCWGIDIDLASLIPRWPGLLSYLAFFVVGWLIFRNVDKLNQIVAGWRWQLAVGTLLVVPYYAYTKFASQNGYTTWDYPRLTVQDFHFENGDPVYALFRDRLIHAEPKSIAGTVQRSIPEPYREFMVKTEAETQNQFAGLLGAINKDILSSAEFTEEIDPSLYGLSSQAALYAAIHADQRTVEQNQRINREILEAGFPAILYSEDVNRPYYYPIRAVYSFVYSLITWSLIFGCIGFSQHHFDRESRFWRYFSDSSYWFYLAHLPIQFQILIWLGDAPWHWLVKFAVYVVGTTVVLLLSYHFLVRPTWVGWLLNGRMASVWKKPPLVATPQPDDAAEPDEDAKPDEDAAADEEGRRHSLAPMPMFLRSSRPRSGTQNHR